MRIKFSIILAFILILCLFALKPISAKVLLVGPGGYETIQEAINNATTSDIIYVYQGDYAENLVINKSISIQGQGPGTKTISGVDSNKNTIEIISNDVTISGLTIQNNVGASNDYSCILIDTFSNCIISNNIIKFGENGLFLNKGGAHTITDNNFEYNDQSGIYLANSDGNKIYENTIQNNDYNGIFLYFDSTDNQIYQNIISENSFGVRISSSNSNTFYKNAFTDNSGEFDSLFCN